MSIHKLSAGSGYDYLTRQVAAFDATGKGHVGLASYYTERGESPGLWVGSGMAAIDGLNAGDAVIAEQMKALFGAGLHPLATQRLEQLDDADLTDANIKAATQLGAPFKIYAGEVSLFRVEVAREFFRAEHGRDPIDAREVAATIAKASRPRTQTVAGYDLTFSPVKSVSALWAVADPHVGSLIEQAHLAAVRDALDFIERYALFTRQGRNGVRQVNVRGLVAAAFTHRDSRAGDPDLHTHVAVANIGGDPGQAALVRAMCTSRARLQLAIAPADAGKTTAMRTLARAWNDSGGQVIGLAPCAAAAAQLRDATAAPAETLAKLTWSIHHNELPDWAERIDRSTLVIIDEAGMADTLSLDTAVQLSSAAAAAFGWSVMINNSPRSALAAYFATSKPATARSG